MNALTLLPLAVSLAVIIAMHHYTHTRQRHTVKAFALRIAAFGITYYLTTLIIEALK